MLVALQTPPSTVPLIPPPAASSAVPILKAVLAAAPDTLPLAVHSSSAPSDLSPPSISKVVPAAAPDALPLAAPSAAPSSVLLVSPPTSQPVGLATNLSGGQGKKGRPTKESIDVALAGLRQLSEELVALSKRTGLSVGKLKSMWFGGTMSFHPWNAYQSWFSHNRARELARLEDEYDGDPDRVSISIIQNTYQLFKDQVTDWENVLKVWTLYEATDDDTSCQQAQRVFQKVCGDIQAKLTTAEAEYGIQSLFVAAGEAIGQDRSLKYSHLTNGVQGFFKDRWFGSQERFEEHFQAAT